MVTMNWNHFTVIMRRFDIDGSERFELANSMRRDHLG